MPSTLPTDRTDPQSDAYRGYEQDHDYTYDSGLIYLPIASSTPQSPARVRLHGGYGLRKIRWKALRLNAPPVIPAYSLDRDEDYDTQDDLDEAEDAVEGATIRPKDRIVNAHTTVFLPVPDPVKGAYVFMAMGEMTLCQTFPTGPRVVGVDALPSGGRPFDMGAIDDAASEQFNDYSAQPTESTERQSQYISSFLTGKTDLINRTLGWPCTIYPPIFTHSQLIQE